MRRREFIAGLDAATWPYTAQEQQRPAMPVIGFLVPFSPEPAAASLDEFRAGLVQAGFIKGRNVVIEARYARNDLGRLLVEIRTQSP
jgi:putative ABC transport system substrate-binding protein